MTQEFAEFNSEPLAAAAAAGLMKRTRSPRGPHKFQVVPLVLITLIMLLVLDCSSLFLESERKRRPLTYFLFNFHVFMLQPHTGASPAAFRQLLCPEHQTCPRHLLYGGKRPFSAKGLKRMANWVRPLCSPHP